MASAFTSSSPDAGLNLPLIRHSGSPGGMLDVVASLLNVLSDSSDGIAADDHRRPQGGGKDEEDDPQGGLFHGMMGLVV
jgi:hypothetical protein